MQLKDIVLLSNTKGENCLSIIIPLDHNQNNDLLIKTCFEEALSKLGQDVAAQQIKRQLSEIYPTLPPSKELEGLGIFVSESKAKVLEFNFPVKKSITLSDNFNTHDLILSANRNLIYGILVMSSPQIKFYIGSKHKLVEIKDRHFPKNFKIKTDFDKNLLSDNHSELLINKAENILSKERRKMAIFSSIDKSLDIYLENNYLMLLLIGSGENIESFKKTSRHSENVITSINNKGKNIPKDKLKSIAFHEIGKYLEKRISDLIIKLSNPENEGKIALGVSEVWEAMLGGNIKTLIVDNGFQLKAYRNKNTGTLLFDKETNKDEEIPDVVCDIIETAIAQGAEILFTETNMINKLGKIAALLK